MAKNRNTIEIYTTLLLIYYKQRELAVVLGPENKLPHLKIGHQSNIYDYTSLLLSNISGLDIKFFTVYKNPPIDNYPSKNRKIYLPHSITIPEKIPLTDGYFFGTIEEVLSKRPLYDKDLEIIQSCINLEGYEQNYDEFYNFKNK